MKLVFVSSTFKDMQFERDALNTYVAPLIDSHLAPFGETVYFGDLRWGVNTTELDSEESSKKVLDVCLDEIDNCKPYMIVLIGERYGWIPGAELLHTAAVTKGVNTPTDISVTQLEIEYGALLNPDYEGRILFYFRSLDKTGMTAAERRDYEAESDLHREKLDALKARILEAYPEQVRYYDAKWNPETHAVEELMPLMDQIRDDLARIFEADIARESNVPWQRRAMNSAHRYYMERSRNYVDVTPGPREQLEGAFVDEAQLVTLVEGKQGSGKTAFISNEYREYLEHEDDKLMVPFVMGLDSYSSLGSSFLKILLYAIEEYLGLEPTENDYDDDEVDTRSRTCDRIKELLEDMPIAVVAVIDDCDHDLFYDLFAGFYGQAKGDPETYLSVACEGLGLYLVIAYSSREEAPLLLAPNYNFSSTYVMWDLLEDEKREFIKTVVRSRHKELSDVVADRIISKSASSSPLYIKLVIDRLLLLDSEDFANIRALGDGMDNINKYMLSIVDNLADDLDGITVELVKEAAERIDRDLVYRLLGILTSFPDALKETQIREMFASFGWEYSALDFAITVKTLSTFISYNPVRAAYQVTNREMLRAIRTHLAENGYGDTPSLLLDYIFGDGNEKPEWYCHSIRLHSLDGDKSELIEIFKAYYHNYENGDESALAFLSDEFMWLVANMDGCAEFLRDLVLAAPDMDFAFLIRKLPLLGQMRDEFNTYVVFLTDVMELLPLDGSDDEDASYNSIAMYVRCRLAEYSLEVDVLLALSVYRDEILPYSEKYYYEDTALEIDLCHQLVINAAVDNGIVERSEEDGDPFEDMDLPEDGYIGSVTAGHFVFAAAHRYRDTDSERYGELLIEALNRYNKFNPTVTEQRQSASTDDFVRISKAFSEGVRFFYEEDTHSAEACLMKLIEFFRIGFHYYGSRMLRGLRDVLYCAELLHDDEDDDFTLYKIRPSVCRMISYRTHQIADRTETIFAYARYLRIYDSVYEIAEDEGFAEMLEVAATELEKYIGDMSENDLYMSSLLPIFDEVFDVFRFLRDTDNTDRIEELIDALMQVSEGEDGLDYRGIEIMRSFLYCLFDSRSTDEDIDAFIRDYKRFKKDKSLSLLRKVTSGMMDTIDASLKE